VETVLRDLFVKEKCHLDFFQDDTIFVITNSEHIINTFRIAKKEGDIGDLIIQFFPFPEHSSGFIEIKTNSNGELSEYPIDFLDEWTNQLFKLL